MGEACSQLPWLGGQAGGRVNGHLGQRPKPETLGLGHVARSVSGPVGANLLRQLKREPTEEKNFKLCKNPGLSVV